MVGRRARARGAGRSGVRSAWYHLQAERAVGRCAQQCEGRRAPAGGGEPSSALGIASEKTRAARAARAGRAEPGCAQAAEARLLWRAPRSAGVLTRSIIHSFTTPLFIHNTPTRKRSHQAKTSYLAHITPASFKCSQTCDAYRAHRHGSESPHPGSTAGLNPCARARATTSPDRRVDRGGHTNTTHTGTSPEGRVDGGSKSPVERGAAHTERGAQKASESEDESSSS